MNLKKQKLTEEEEEILYQVATEFQDKGFTNTHCPRCKGKLLYQGNFSGYRIICEENCGVVINCRGI